MPDRDSKKLIVWPRLRKEKTGMSSADLLETEIQSSADSCSKGVTNQMDPPDGKKDVKVVWSLLACDSLVVCYRIVKAKKENKN